MDSKSIEQIVNTSFLARVPEIMDRGGFTIETAIEQAYQEEMILIARLSKAAGARNHYRDDPYREVVDRMSDQVYERLQPQGNQ